MPILRSGIAFPSERGGRLFSDSRAVEPCTYVDYSKKAMKGKTV
jgi:hypothetical protein